MRRQDGADFDMRVERSNGVAMVSVNAFGKDGRSRDQLHPQAHAVAQEQSVSVFDARERMEARVPLKQQGSKMFRTSSNGSDGASRMQAYSYPDEYHACPTNIDKLRAISAETGGLSRRRMRTAGEATMIATAL